MKKIILYSLLLGAALLLPVQGVDVGKLLPVELISFSREEDALTITTDVGAAGTGATIKEAVADMKATASGIVFLDTADYLLIKDLTDEEVETLKDHLKPSIRICSTSGEIDLPKACEYLRVHKPQQRLKDWEEEKGAEVLVAESGKKILKEK